MNTAQVFPIFFPVFTLLAVGYCFGKFRKIDLNSLTELVIYVASPCLVFSSVSQRHFGGTDFLVLGGSAVFVILGVGAIAFVVARLRGIEDRGIYLASMFMNSANLPFPLVLLAFGEVGLARAIMYFLIVSLLQFSLGVYLATFQRSLRPILRFPILYAFFAALVVSIGKIPIPSVVLVPINMMGNLAITMMVLALGYKISTLKARSIGLPLATSALRIGGGFLLGLLFVEIFHVSGLNRAIILLDSAMPSAVFNFVLAEKYRLSPELVASTILISTLVSLITTPILLGYLLSSP